MLLTYLLTLVVGAELYAYGRCNDVRLWSFQRCVLGSVPRCDNCD